MDSIIPIFKNSKKDYASLLEEQLGELSRSLTSMSMESLEKSIGISLSLIGHPMTKQFLAEAHRYLCTHHVLSRDSGLTDIQQLEMSLKALQCIRLNILKKTLKTET